MFILSLSFFLLFLSISSPSLALERKLLKSSVEEKLLGKNHSAMFFAAQALATSIVGAVASSLVYENIKMLFISKEASGIVWAQDATEAALKLGVDVSSIYNFGTLLVPIVVSVMCVLGFILAFRMPKNYSPKLVAKELGLEKEYEEKKHLFIDVEEEKEIESESILVNTALWVLSGTIFSIVWKYGILKQTKTFKTKTNLIINWLISLFIFPYTSILCYKSEKKIQKLANERNLKVKYLSIIILYFSKEE